MKITTIFTTHDSKRIRYLLDAVDSVDTDVIVVLDDTWIANVIHNRRDVEIVLDESINSLSEARNRGARHADADVYAFLDDDVIASDQWSDEILNAYENGAVAAGGPAVPVWPSYQRPIYLTEQWDWLVGCGPYHEEERPVRNTYGCNISFRSDVFDELGGFDTAYGKRDDLAQGEETELCRRMADEFGYCVRYRPNAVVEHRVFKEQLDIVHLAKRAYEQGRTKARLGFGDEETSFLREAISDIAKNPAGSLYLSATAAGYLTRN